MTQIRQMALTFKRSNKIDKGCEYGKSCLECPYPICVKEELSEGAQTKYIVAFKKQRRRKR